MAVPVANLLLWIVEIEKCAHGSPVPSGQWCQGAGKGEDLIGAATLDGRTGKATLDVGKLNGIQVNCHDIVVAGKLHGSATCRRNAEDASTGRKCVQLN